jgi:hypothetical protein
MTTELWPTTSVAISAENQTTSASAQYSKDLVSASQFFCPLIALEDQKADVNHTPG